MFYLLVAESATVSFYAVQGRKDVECVSSTILGRFFFAFEDAGRGK